MILVETLVINVPDDRHMQELGKEKFCSDTHRGKMVSPVD